MNKRKKTVVWVLLLGFLFSLLPGFDAGAQEVTAAQESEAQEGTTTQEGNAVQEEAGIYQAAPSTEVYAPGVSTNGNHEYRSNDFPYPLYCVSPTRWGPHHADSTVTYYCNAWSDAGFAFPYTVNVDGETVDIRNVVFYYENNKDGLNFGIGGSYYQQAHFDLAYYMNLIGKNEPEDAYSFDAWNAEARNGVPGGVAEVDIRSRLKTYSARGAALIAEMTEGGRVPTITMYVMKTDSSYTDGNGQTVRFQDLITYQFSYTEYSNLYLTIKKSSKDIRFAPSMDGIEYQLTDTYGNVFVTFTLDRDGYTKSVAKGTNWTNASYEFVGQDSRVVDSKNVAAAHIRRKGSGSGLPAGAFLIKESKTNNNYSISVGGTPIPAVANGRFQVLTLQTNENLSDVPVYPSRGNLALEKAATEDGRPMEGVKFAVKNISTGEVHYLYTDRNGKATTEVSAYTAAVNQYDRKTDYDGTGNEVWFRRSSDGTEMNPQADYTGSPLGALPVGKYEVTEMSCSANRGYQLLKPVTVEIRNREVAVVQERNGKLYNSPLPEIRTMAAAKTEQGLSKVLPASGEQTLVDTVYYKNLRADTTFTLIASLMYIDVDGTPVPFTDTENQEVKARKTFRTKAEYERSEFEICGEETVTFSHLDLTGRQGERFVVFERLYLGDVSEEDAAGNHYAKTYPESQEPVFPLCHEDISDADQTVMTPDLGTTAKGTEGGNELICSAESFTDTVQYTHLCPETVYILHGVAMDRETGEPLLLAGKTVEAEQRFETGPENDGEGGACGAVDMVFTIPENAEEELSGKTIVVFETLTDEQGNPVADHRDITDEAQALTVPEIKTVLTDDKTGTHESSLEEVTLTDRVSFRNLRAGRVYRMQGILVRKDTGEPLRDAADEVISASTEFTAPDSGEGVVEVVFQLNAGLLNLDGLHLVCFEECIPREASLPVGYHRDIESADQTVYFPKLEPKVKSGGPKEKPKETPEEPVETPKTKTVTSLQKTVPETPVKKADAPKTGDRFPKGPFLLLLAVSAGGILTLRGVGKRRKTSRK